MLRATRSDPQAGSPGVLGACSQQNLLALTQQPRPLSFLRPSRISPPYAILPHVPYHSAASSPRSAPAPSHRPPAGRTSAASRALVSCQPATSDLPDSPATISSTRFSHSYPPGRALRSLQQRPCLAASLLPRRYRHHLPSFLSIPFSPFPTSHGACTAASPFPFGPCPSVGLPASLPPHAPSGGQPGPCRLA